MDNTRQKYVRLQGSDIFIFFPEVMEHSRFKNFNPISAGFCHIRDKKVDCFGESFSLGLKCHEDDTKLATKQIFGFDAMFKI
jgi:hypothetical protein